MQIFCGKRSFLAEPKRREVFEKLKENNIRVELDESNETLGKKIRQGKMEKVPYLLIIGDKEMNPPAGEKNSLREFAFKV